MTLDASTAAPLVAVGKFETSAAVRPTAPVRPATLVTCGAGVRSILAPGRSMQGAHGGGGRGGGVGLCRHCGAELGLGQVGGVVGQAPRPCRGRCRCRRCSAAPARCPSTPTSRRSSPPPCAGPSGRRGRACVAGQVHAALVAAARQAVATWPGCTKAVTCVPPSSRTRQSLTAGPASAAAYGATAMPYSRSDGLPDVAGQVLQAGLERVEVGPLAAQHRPDAGRLSRRRVGSKAARKTLPSAAVSLAVRCQPAISSCGVVPVRRRAPAGRRPGSARAGRRSGSSSRCRTRRTRAGPARAARPRGRRAAAGSRRRPPPARSATSRPRPGCRCRSGPPPAPPRVPGRPSRCTAACPASGGPATSPPALSLVDRKSIPRITPGDTAWSMARNSSVKTLSDSSASV